MRKLDAPSARKGSARPSLGVLILFGWKCVHYAQVRTGSIWRRVCWWLLALNWIFLNLRISKYFKRCPCNWPLSVRVTSFSAQSEPTVILLLSLRTLKTHWQQQVFLFAILLKVHVYLIKHILQADTVSFLIYYTLAINLGSFHLFFKASEADYIQFFAQCSVSSAWIQMQHASLSWS